MLGISLTILMNYKSDFLQKYLFANEMISSYRFQNETKEFIEKNQLELITEVKIIENIINTNKLYNDSLIIFVNNPGHLKDIDTSDNINLKNSKTIKRRKIITKFYDNLFGNTIEKNNSFQISNFTVKDNKVYSIHIFDLSRNKYKYFYNQGVTFYPDGFTENDKNEFSYFVEFSSFGSNYYLQYCRSRYYIYKNKWVFKVEGQCNG